MTRTSQAFATYSTDMTSAVFLPTSVDANQVKGLTLVPTVFYVNNEETGILSTPTRGVRIQDRIARLEKSPRRAAALAQARQRVGRWLADEQPSGTDLVALRLAAGLSQQQLAARLGTKQSNISRLERSPGNPSMSTLRTWSAALGITMDRLVTAIESAAGERRE